jgi:hypothetical protein
MSVALNNSTFETPMTCYKRAEWYSLAQHLNAGSAFNATHAITSCALLHFIP